MVLRQFQNKKYALIIANGQIPQSDILAELAAKADYILAADGGVKKVLKNGICPNAVIGDLDSVDEQMFKKLKKAGIPLIKKTTQETNDLEKSLKYLTAKGHRNIIVTGIHGKRDDHAFVAYQLMKKYRSKANIILITDYSEIFILKPGVTKIFTHTGHFISLFGYPRAYGVTTTALKFPLKEENLFETSRGISNEAKENIIQIEIKKGHLLVFNNLRKNE
jgi:thiamine pyrophosphokinase